MSFRSINKISILHLAKYTNDLHKYLCGSNFDVGSYSVWLMFHGEAVLNSGNQENFRMWIGH